MTYKTLDEINNRIRQLENEIDCLQELRRKKGYYPIEIKELGLPGVVKTQLIGGYVSAGSYRTDDGDWGNSRVYPTVGDIIEVIENGEVWTYSNMGKRRIEILVEKLNEHGYKVRGKT